MLRYPNRLFPSCCLCQCTVAADGTTHCEGTETQLDVATAAVLASKTANKAVGSFGG